MLGFCFNSQYDLSLKLAPASHQIRFKTKTNHDFGQLPFPALRVVFLIKIRIFIGRVLVVILFPCSDWPLWLLWFWFMTLVNRNANKWFFYPFVCILTQVVVWVKRVRQCSALSIKGIRVIVIPVYKTDMNVNVFIVGVWILRDSYIWSSTPHIKGFLEYLTLFLLAGNVSCERFNLVCQILLN